MIPNLYIKKYQKMLGNPPFPSTWPSWLFFGFPTTNAPCPNVSHRSGPQRRYFVLVTKTWGVFPMAYGAKLTHSHRIHGTLIFTYSWLFCKGWKMVNVGKYTIYGSYGIGGFWPPIRKNISRIKLDHFRQGFFSENEKHVWNHHPTRNPGSNISHPKAFPIGGIC